ncbi:structural maintenance of chromosomes protein 4-like [Lingula anatina]|uniref:Structural maintenance of chromosomes protein n=1 Tax=Lingula anatina TaxID=7574 RepID=A0A1S3H4R9_LINAN|nr:structural maintenance of chromosomes protein 4-like [Lingula anatina]|eukprot:XP_013380461.1 structural maintenance of chromosomes protein 4-like [Lingula anatina]
MLFVFGYRANKIRSKKISILIHSSENHPNINSCCVAVHFQKITDTGLGDDDYEVVPNSNFVVSRTAFRDNSSYYQVDGKKKTYKEVATLLRGSGIDLDHNRFLILQGEVEQIAMMKPKALTEHDEGMLEFLEDIVGSSRFKEPIDLLSKRVEELNELRAEKLNRVKAVEKDKDDLQGDRDLAVQYLQMENDITRQKNVAYQLYILETSGNMERAQAKCDEVGAGLKHYEERIQAIRDQNKEKKNEHEKLFKHYEELCKKCDDCKKKFDALETKDVKNREDLKHAKGKAKKLGKAEEAERHRLEELRQVPEKSQQDIETNSKWLEKLEEVKAEVEAKMAEIHGKVKEETAGLQGEKEIKETELMELQKNVNETKSKYEVAQSELDIYLSNQKSETNKLRDMENGLETATKTISERKESVKLLERSIPETEAALQKTKKDLGAATALENQLTAEVQRRRLKVEEVRSSMQASSSKSRVLAALTEAKKQGKIPGIRGRLGDLGAIDEKYDIAISTACGSLDNVVVDSINTAQCCVEFLKKNNIGSATFMGLDKMEKWREHVNKRIKTPENVPRLFDLVRVGDDSIRTAFYFALRDTLVASDLEQATRIAYGKQRFRVVTLKGDLIDQSGTMSGGGGRVSKGRMGSALVADIEPRQLQEMERELEQTCAAAEDSRVTRDRLEESVLQMEKDLKQMKLNVEKFRMEVKSLTEREVSLKDQIIAQKERVKAAAPDAKQLKAMETSVSAYKTDYEKAAYFASKVEMEVQRLHQDIMEYGGEELKALDTKLKKVKGDMDKATGAITKANVALKNSDRNMKKCEAKLKSVEEEIEENKHSIANMEQMFKAIEEEATQVMTQFDDMKAQSQECEDGLKVLKAEREKLEEEETQIEKNCIEIRHEMEKYETVLKENRDKIRHWEKAKSKLALHKFDDGTETEGSLEVIPAEELAKMSKETVAYELTILEEKIVQVKPNLAAIAEYKKKEELYLQRVAELDQITDLRDQQRQQYEELRKQRLDEFMSGFSIITSKLKEMYQMITLGGDAELELVDSLDPFSEGIVFSVRPPKKSWKNISNLSGGEKTLSSLALVFALHHYRPTPLYVMDEIDAALDFKNVSIVANYIKERTKNAQFIIISLRNNMFELADRLVGIYKTNNATKSVTINPKKLSLPLQEVQQDA